MDLQLQHNMYDDVFDTEASDSSNINATNGLHPERAISVEVDRRSLAPEINVIITRPSSSGDHHHDDVEPQHSVTVDEGKKKEKFRIHSDIFGDLEIELSEEAIAALGAKNVDLQPVGEKEDGPSDQELTPEDDIVPEISPNVEAGISFESLERETPEPVEVTPTITIVEPPLEEFAIISSDERKEGSDDGSSYSSSGEESSDAEAMFSLGFTPSFSKDEKEEEEKEEEEEEKEEEEEEEEEKEEEEEEDEEEEEEEEEEDPKTMFNFAANKKKKEEEEEEEMKRELSHLMPSTDQPKYAEFDHGFEHIARKSLRDFKPVKEESTVDPKHNFELRPMKMGVVDTPNKKNLSKDSNNVVKPKTDVIVEEVVAAVEVTTEESEISFDALFQEEEPEEKVEEKEPYVVDEDEGLGIEIESGASVDIEISSPDFDIVQDIDIDIKEDKLHEIEIEINEDIDIDVEDDVTHIDIELQKDIEISIEDENERKLSSASSKPIEEEASEELDTVVFEPVDDNTDMDVKGGTIHNINIEIDQNKGIEIENGVTYNIEIDVLKHLISGVDFDAMQDIDIEEDTIHEVEIEINQDIDIDVKDDVTYNIDIEMQKDIDVSIVNENQRKLSSVSSQSIQSEASEELYSMGFKPVDANIPPVPVVPVVIVEKSECVEEIEVEVETSADVYAQMDVDLDADLNLDLDIDIDANIDEEIHADEYADLISHKDINIGIDLDDLPEDELLQKIERGEVKVVKGKVVYSEPQDMSPGKDVGVPDIIFFAPSTPEVTEEEQEKEIADEIPIIPEFKVETEASPVTLMRVQSVEEDSRVIVVNGFRYERAGSHRSINPEPEVKPDTVVTEDIPEPEVASTTEAPPPEPSTTKPPSKIPSVKTKRKRRPRFLCACTKGIKD